ncbi:hypothetical protein P4V06_00315, partial [Brevibacillus parabrevis]|nr:hypothetical protein [Brevibacillus parabrevis]
VSVDDLVSLLVEQQEAKLKEAVTAGKLTQEQADKMNENAAERVQKMVEGSFTKGAFRGHGEKKAEQDKAGEQ